MPSISIKRVAVCLAATFAVAAARAEGPPVLPDAAQTDPATLKIMSGFPPPADKTVRFGDGTFYKFPLTRWSFSHMREVVPTANVRRGERPPSNLPREERDLTSIAFQTMDGQATTLGDALPKTFTDGIVVLHRGKVVFERYFGAADPHRPHIAFSMTKSFVGTLAAMLVADGKLDPNAPVTKYVPELGTSAYADATVGQVMDMRIGVKYSEDYANPKAEVFDYARAGGMLPAGPNYAGPKSFYEFLAKVEKEGEHGGAFAYKTPNAEVLAWIVKRASGQSLAALFSDRIWSKLGTEEDGYFTVDSVGSESGGGGFNGTLRDFARFGEMIRNMGQFNGQQIVPRSVVADLFAGGDKAAFAKAGFQTLPGWSYHAMWWVSHNADGAMMARGIHGQNIYIDPKAQTVIARIASHPIAANGFTDPIILPAYQAIADSLVKGR